MSTTVIDGQRQHMSCGVDLQTTVERSSNPDIWLIHLTDGEVVTTIEIHRDSAAELAKALIDRAMSDAGEAVNQLRKWVAGG